MTHLIDKSVLVAEIERRKQVAFGWMETAPNDAIEAEFKLCDDILSFLDTLEVKEVDFEKETKKWWKEHLHLGPKNQLWMDAHQSIVFAKHFFELGLKAQKGEEV